MLHLLIKEIVVHEDMAEGKRNTTVKIHFNFMKQGSQLTVKSQADAFKNRIQGNEVYPLWRKNIYKTQSNIEVSQSFRLLFNYLGMTLHTPAFSEQALTVFVQLYHRIIQRQLLHNFIFSSFLYPNSSLFIVRAISLMSLLNVSLSPINSETLGAFLIWACDVGCSLSVLFFKYSQILNILSNLADQLISPPLVINNLSQSFGAS